MDNCFLLCRFFFCYRVYVYMQTVRCWQGRCNFFQALENISIHFFKNYPSKKILVKSFVYHSHADILCCLYMTQGSVGNFNRILCANTDTSKKIGSGSTVTHLRLQSYSSPRPFFSAFQENKILLNLKSLF